MSYLDPPRFHFSGQFFYQPVDDQQPGRQLGGAIVNPLFDPKGMAEALSSDDNVAYNDGSLVRPQEDPKKDHLHPQSPSFVVSLARDVVFLERAKAADI